LEVRDILDAGLDLLYRGDHRGELPRNPKLPERMGARTGRAFLAEANLTEAAEFIRVVGGNALNGRKVKVTQAVQAVRNARLVVQALRAKLDPSAPPYVPQRPLTEAQTRREYIDVYLQEAGWEVLGEKDVALPGKAGVEIRVEGMPPDGQDGYCDYVLFGKDGRPLAVVEAKRTSESPEKGCKQVKLYAERLAAKYGVEPVMYYTNGYEIWCADGIYPNRRVHAYRTLEELEKLIHQRGRRDLTDTKPKPEIAGRPYQIMAVQSVCDRFNEKRRHALLVMATGTGKTRVAVSLVDVLTRNRWAEHVLFLADRTELVKQAYRAFQENLPDTTYSVLNLKAHLNDPATARVVLSTYQTMINYIDGEDKKFTSGRFDLIIIDEAHRSIFNKYGTIFDYFDSLLVGLTATPRDEVDRSTYRLFDCEQGVPNFAYSIEEGVHDGYLRPWKLVNKTTPIMRDGITYADLTPEEREEAEEAFAEAGYEETPEQTSSASIFKAVYNEPTCCRVLEDLMREGRRVQSGELLGKTIVFAVNHEHAKMVVECFHRLYPHLPDDYCTLIDNYETFSDVFVDRFRDEQGIRIAVSVDMLDTGVDVPEVLNLVFFKRVRSRIKFFQMIGRGTRPCRDVFGAGKDKDFFRIFDYCGNFEFFGAGKDGDEDSGVCLSVSQRIFSTRAALMLALQDVSNQSIPWRAAYWKTLGRAVLDQTLALREQRRTRLMVRKHLPCIDRYRLPDAWRNLSEDRLSEIDRHITPLVEDLSDDAELVKLFDERMLKVELALAQTGSAKPAAAAVMKLRVIAKALLQIGTIQQVLDRRAELEKLESAAFWERATLEEAEELRLALRALAVFVKTDRKALVVLQLDDETETLPNPEGMPDLRTYREKVFEFVRANWDRPVIEKIRRLERITEGDLAELERILWHDLGTKEEYDAEHYAGSLSGFVRKLSLVDRDAINEKFGEFLMGTRLNARQQAFVKEVIEYLEENGEVTPDDLTNEEPFVNENIAELFADRMPELQEIVRRLREILPDAA
ncbi:MAG: DEAD/DEAH box helicase family protein, partial [Kiritimatiellae bacterium]|nr:DEAD/DEAH box helicase family protein [Kiritimatiellia bacterium]